MEEFLSRSRDSPLLAAVSGVDAETSRKRRGWALCCVLLVLWVPLRAPGLGFARFTLGMSDRLYFVWGLNDAHQALASLQAVHTVAQARYVYGAGLVPTAICKAKHSRTPATIARVILMASKLLWASLFHLLKLLNASHSVCSWPITSGFKKL